MKLKDLLIELSMSVKTTTRIQSPPAAPTSALHTPVPLCHPGHCEMTVIAKADARNCGRLSRRHLASAPHGSTCHHANAETWACSEKVKSTP